jgi:glycosyltransferase involved in cell wall biosynthesis
MWRDVRIAVVVPAYNEEQHIGLTLRSVPRYVDRVVVVDDGSGDDTANEVARRVADDPRVQLIRHPKNLGVGSALCSGYARAFADGAEIVAVMAGDGQMHPDDLAGLLEPLVADRADYVKGDRLSHPEAFARMPLHRFVGNHLLSLATRVVTSLPVRDSQCGYTALHRRAAEHVPWHALWRGYGYPNDLLGLLSRTHARVTDVIVRPVYADEQSGIRLHHALLVIPFVLASILWRRLRARLASPMTAIGIDHSRKGGSPARVRAHEAPLMLAIGDNGLPPSEP